MNNSTIHLYDGTARKFSARRARGVAMLLVLIALSVGTVLAAASLTSRDNSPAIGRNAGLVASVNWAADAGANYVIAVLETPKPWRSMRGGVILQDYPMAGARVDAVVTNLAGNPPANGDREVIVLSRATIDGVAAVVEKRVSLSLPTNVFQPVDPFISEFAIFVNESLKIEPGARIRTFANSPESTTLEPIKIGMGFSAAADLVLDPDAILHGIQFILDIAGSMALEQMAEDAPNAQSPEKLPIDVPAVPAVLPGAFDLLQNVTTKGIKVKEGAGYIEWSPTLGFANPRDDLLAIPASSGLFSFRASGSLQRVALLMMGSVMIAQPSATALLAKDNGKGKGNGNGNGSVNGNNWINTSSTTLPASGQYDKLHISNGAELTIDAANGRFYETRDLILDSEAVLLIRGKVVLYVKGDVMITQGSTVEFADDASGLAVYVGGDLLVDDSALGVDRSHGLDRARHYSKLVTNTRPQRLRLIALSPSDGGSNKPVFDIKTNSLVLGCIHAPHAKVEIRDESVLIGQVVARKFVLKRDSTLLYDPRMDSRAGYTSRLGPIYAGQDAVATIEQILAQSSTIDGTWAIAQQVNMAMRNAWTDSNDWTIEIDDATITDTETYYDGYVKYESTLSSSTTTTTTTTSTIDPMLQQSAPLIADPGFQMPAPNLPALTEEDVMNTGNPPTRRTPGRVRASTVSRRQGSGS